MLDNAPSQDSDEPSKLGPETSLKEHQILTINVSNFKGIDEAHIELKDITYLVGGNNSGKSSFLQAIHTAYSCARLSFERGSAKEPAKVLPEVDLLYRPTAHFIDLGHRGKYRAKSTTDVGRVEFSPISSPDSKFTVAMYKAHNHNNAGVELIGEDPIRSNIADTSRLFSVYVPGLTGIPLHEEYKSYGVILSTAAGGEANLVFRNILLHLQRLHKINSLEDALSRVILGTGRADLEKFEDSAEGKRPLSFEISFDEKRDQYVEVRLQIGQGSPVPIDLWGTGVLQLTQILAYAYLFQPTLFLIDEPDSHLHPSWQKALATTFSVISEQLGCRIITTTHSRHMITAAPKGTHVVWMEDGKASDGDAREVSEVLLELGALDSFDRNAKTIIFTEDAAGSSLKQCIESLPDSFEMVSFISYEGVKNAPKVTQMNELLRQLNQESQIIIHRDRDCLTDAELDKWSEPYRDAGMKVFVPSLTDTESYYCRPEYIADALGWDTERASALVRECLKNMHGALRAKFDGKRRNANSIFWAQGGSPRNEDLWNEWENDQETPWRHVCGKELLRAIKGRLGNKADKDKIGATPSVILTGEIREFFKQVSKDDKQ